MKTLDELKQALERARERYRRVLKEKAASPNEIMAKAKVHSEEIMTLEQEIAKHGQRQ